MKHILLILFVSLTSCKLLKPKLPTNNLPRIVVQDKDPDALPSIIYSYEDAYMMIGMMMPKFDCVKKVDKNIEIYNLPLADTIQVKIFHSSDGKFDPISSREMSIDSVGIGLNIVITDAGKRPTQQKLDTLIRWCSSHRCQR